MDHFLKCTSYESTECLEWTEINGHDEKSQLKVAHIVETRQKEREIMIEKKQVGWTFSG